MQSREQLISYLKGIIHGLEYFRWSIEHACKTMLLHLVSNGFLTKTKETYEVQIK